MKCRYCNDTGYLLNGWVHYKYESEDSSYGSVECICDIGKSKKRRQKMAGKVLFWLRSLLGIASDRKKLEHDSCYRAMVGWGMAEEEYEDLLEVDE